MEPSSNDVVKKGVIILLCRAEFAFPMGQKSIPDYAKQKDAAVKLEMVVCASNTEQR